MIEFSTEEKCRAFDELAGRFFNRNFSLASKGEIELIMFHHYMKKKKSEHTGQDGRVEYAAISDYSIRKELGISQQRVRNLRVKEQLFYPENLNAEEEFAGLLKHARYDKAAGKIMVSIPDPNIYIEVQNLIEEKGGFIERQLNSRLLIMRVEYFLELVSALESEENQKQIRRIIKNAGKKDGAFENVNIGKLMLTLGVDISTIAANLSAIISPQNALGMALLNLISSKG